MNPTQIGNFHFEVPVCRTSALSLFSSSSSSFYGGGFGSPFYGGGFNRGFGGSGLSIGHSSFRPVYRGGGGYYRGGRGRSCGGW